MLKRELEGLYEKGTLELDDKSCEMLAEELLDYLEEEYPFRDYVVSVSEDNENGARIERYED
jgi:hypothetical protein